MKMKQLYFIFLFTFLLLNIFIFSVFASPVAVIRGINGHNLSESSNTWMNTNMFFINYDTIQVQAEGSYFDFNYSATVTFNQFEYCQLTSIMDICTRPLSDDVILSLTSFKDKLGCTDFQITAWNSSNLTTLVAQSFTICVTVPVLAENLTTSSQIGLFTDAFMGLFPDSSKLSTAQKFGFVFIFIIIISALILLLSYNVSGNIKGFIGYVVFLIDVALFLFFIAIGYIPVAILIVLVLVIIVLAYFKITGGGK